MTCKLCNKPLLDGEALHGATGNHWDCEYPLGYKSPAQEYEAAKERLDNALTSFGFKPKAGNRARPGYGGSVQKIMPMISAAAKEYYGSDNVTDINIYLSQGIWRHKKMDVRLFDVGFKVDGLQHSVGSWYGIGHLLKYKQLKMDGDDLWPVLESKRSRKK